MRCSQVCWFAVLRGYITAPAQIWLGFGNNFHHVAVPINGRIDTEGAVGMGAKRTCVRRLLTSQPCSLEGLEANEFISYSNGQSEGEGYRDG